MRLPLFALLLGSCLTLSLGCQTNNDPSQQEIPKITRDMPVKEAYGYGLTYGGEVLQQVKEVIRERRELPALNKLAETDLLKGHDSMDPGMLMHAAHLYRASTNVLNPKLLSTLLASREESSRKIGWRLAAAKPSVEVAQVIENFLTQALANGDEDRIISPEMANAVQENGLKSAYTFLVRGLQEDGSPEFANAMLSLDPNRAAGPFLSYLTKADFEDLRQLNQKNINVYTCTVIFRYLLDNPLPISNANVSQLFMFAVSRNRGLADMANSVLEKHIPEHRTALALMLGRLPVQVQLAFVENSQREMTSNLRLFLSDLKDTAQQKEVIDELSSGQRDVAQ